MIPSTVHAFDNPPRKNRQLFFLGELLKKSRTNDNTPCLTAVRLSGSSLANIPPKRPREDGHFLLPSCASAGLIPRLRRASLAPSYF